jgi:hypothetical protein
VAAKSLPCAVLVAFLCASFRPPDRTTPAFQPPHHVAARGVFPCRSRRPILHTAKIRVLFDAFTNEHPCTLDEGVASFWLDREVSAGSEELAKQCNI